MSYTVSGHRMHRESTANDMLVFLLLFSMQLSLVKWKYCTFFFSKLYKSVFFSALNENKHNVAPPSLNACIFGRYNNDTTMPIGPSNGHIKHHYYYYLLEMSASLLGVQLTVNKVTNLFETESLHPPK